MDAVGFKAWLSDNRVYSTSKQVTDCVSRVKRVEKALAEVLSSDFSFEEEYEKDKGQFVKTLLSKRGLNQLMAEINTPALPIGTNQMDTIVTAVKKYFIYLDSK